MELPNQSRMRRQVKLWVFLVMPVGCAFIFYATIGPRRVTWKDRLNLESDWVRRPLTTEFLPEEGADVHIGDPLLKVAWIGEKSTFSGHSWLISPKEMIGDTWHYGFDAGGDRELNPASAEGLAQLPTYLNRLPPSDHATVATKSVIIAFPSNGTWTIRRYRRGTVPSEANDLAKLLGFRSSFDGKPVQAW